MIKKSCFALVRRAAAGFLGVASVLLMTGGVGQHKEMDNVYFHNVNAEMKIALTFDDGPQRTNTPEILDVLEKNSIPATFFVVGQCAECCPDLIRRALSEGHEIGNHTYSHLALHPGMIGRMLEEIAETEELIYEIAEYRTRLFRPPEGLCSEQIAEYAASCDYSVILWNIDTRDWAHTGARKMVELILRNVESGDIILFHDGISGKSHTAEALRIVIPKLKARGFRFVTVSELLGSE